jgi:hypothetical protein
MALLAGWLANTPSMLLPNLQTRTELSFTENTYLQIIRKFSQCTDKPTWQRLLAFAHVSIAFLEFLVFVAIIAIAAIALVIFTITIRFGRVDVVTRVEVFSMGTIILSEVAFTNTAPSAPRASIEP